MNWILFSVAMFPDGTARNHFPQNRKALLFNIASWVPDPHCRPYLETFEKCSILFKVKEGENFNHRNTLSISRINILSLTQRLGR